MCRSLQWLPGRQNNPCLQGLCSVCIEHINYTYVINSVILVRCTLMSPTNVWAFFYFRFCVCMRLKICGSQTVHMEHIALHRVDQTKGLKDIGSCPLSALGQMTCPLSLYHLLTWSGFPPAHFISTLSEDLSPRRRSWMQREVEQFSLSFVNIFKLSPSTCPSLSFSLS